MAKTSGGSKASMPWSVKGVTHEAREVAKDQSTADGGTMGAWLTGVVRRVGAAEASGKPLAGKSLALKPDAPRSDGVGSDGAGSGGAGSGGAGGTSGQVEPVDEVELVDMVSERIQATEDRLVLLLGNIEDIILKLSDRLERLEERVDTRPNPQIAPDPNRDIPNLD